MNQPEYILTDVFAEIVTATKVALDAAAPGLWPVLHYEFGEIEELNETLKQLLATKGAAGGLDLSSTRFPLVWLMQPYKIVNRGMFNLYGETEDLNIVIINTTEKEWKASQRMANNYKTIIYPIYRELLNQIILHPAVTGDGEANAPKHDFWDKYYFGEEGKTVLNDVVDASIMLDVKLGIYNNQNCTPQIFI